jgi:hypothetical protein
MAKKIRITGASKPYYWYANKVGEVFDVISVNHDMYIVNHRGEKRIVFESNLEEVIEQPEPSAPSYAEVSELLHEAKNEEALVFLTDNHRVVAQTQQPDDIVTHNGKQYRKVKRKAAVGELVVVTNATSTEDTYENGSVLTVTESIEESGYQYASIYVEETDLCVLDSEYHVLELVEQSGQSETLTERDLIANLAQEVVELKRQLSDAKTDIADLEDRVDENEKDVEEVIGRINDVSDAVVPVDVIEKVIAEFRELEGHAEKLCDHYEDNGIKELAQFQDGKSHAFLDAQKLLKEALRNG